MTPTRQSATVTWSPTWRASSGRARRAAAGDRFVSAGIDTHVGPDGATRAYHRLADGTGFVFVCNVRKVVTKVEAD